MKVTVDRIESRYAVVALEDDTLANLPIMLLPEGAKEGSIIEIVCSDNDTQNRKNEIQQKMDHLFGR